MATRQSACLNRAARPPPDRRIRHDLRVHNLPARGRPIPRRGLAKLLGGLNVANSGTVSWNGSDIQQMDDVSVREHVAFVFQDYTRFFFSAAENIGFGRWQHAHDREAVTEAARDAGAVDFLEVFPAGYDTLLAPSPDSRSDVRLRRNAARA